MIPIALIRNPAATIFGAAAVGLGAVLVYTWLHASWTEKALRSQIADLRSDVARDERTIGQLQGAITFQNAAIEGWRKQAADAAEAGAAALSEVDKLRKVKQKEIVRYVQLAAKEPNATACVEADKRLLEFYK